MNVKFEDLCWECDSSGGARAFVRAALAKATEQFGESEDEESEVENDNSESACIVMSCPSCQHLFIGQVLLCCRKQCRKCSRSQSKSL